MSGEKERISFRAALAAVALALLALSAGYAIADGGGAGAAGADVAEQQTYHAAFAAARSGSFTHQLAAGIEDGLAEGAEKGAVQGGYRGRDEALTALSEDSADDFAAQGQRSESKSDIGYAGDAAEELDALDALGEVASGPPGGIEPARYVRLWAQVPVAEKQWAARVGECESGTDPTLTALGGEYRGAFMFTQDAWNTSPNSPGGDPIEYSWTRSRTSTERPTSSSSKRPA